MEKFSQRSKTSVRQTTTTKREKALLKPTGIRDTISEKNTMKVDCLRNVSKSSGSSSSDEELSSIAEDESRRVAGKLTPQYGLKFSNPEKQGFTSATKKGSTNRHTPVRDFANRKLDLDQQSQGSIQSTSSYRSFDNKSQHSAISAFLPMTSRILNNHGRLL